MNQIENTSAGENTVSEVIGVNGNKTSWGDLFLYFAWAFGGQAILITLINSFYAIDLEDGLNLVELFVVVIVPFLVFLSAFYILGIKRKNITADQIGLSSVHWQWKYLIYAIGLIILFMPIRMLAAFGIEFLIYGNIEFLSLGERNDFFNAFTEIPFGFLAMLIGVGIFAPIGEEIFFRGLIYNWFRSRISFSNSVILSSLLFGFAHYDSPGVMASSFVMGAVIAYAYERTKSLWLPILIHVLTNSGAVMLMFIASYFQESGLLP